MDSQVVLNIVTIAISTILSVGAIILSIWFYKESNKQNKETSLMQTDIKNAILKLEQLYDRTYTDTFGALKTQLDAMQKHIFTSSVGDTNSSEPNQLRFYLIGCITDKRNLSIDELCKQIKGYKKSEITEAVYSLHREGIVSYDGNKIVFLNKDTNQIIEGQGTE
jgi:hypothetical protein